MAQEEVTPEEIQVEDALQTAMRDIGEMETHWGMTLFHIDDIPFEGNLRDFPNMPSPFLDRVVENVYPDLYTSVRNLQSDIRQGSLPLPSDEAIHTACQFTPTYKDLPLASEFRKMPTPKPHRHSVYDFKGGETMGLARLQQYVWGRGGLEEYEQKRQSLDGVNTSSVFSPWMARGCLSPRRIWREVVMFETRRNTTESTRTMRHSLGYRDWMKFVTLKYGLRIFGESGVIGNPHQTRFQWQRKETDIQRWKEGKTGVPLIDAIMRELRETGYIANRSRIVAANFFTTELWLDWRLGAAHFETYLIDYDVTSNWVNWIIAANLLTEENLHLQIVPYAMEFDPDGTYTKKWVPEVAGIPSHWVHRPWKLPDDVLSQYGVAIGRDYPRPIKGPYLNY